MDRKSRGGGEADSHGSVLFTTILTRNGRLGLVLFDRHMSHVACLNSLHIKRIHHIYCVVFTNLFCS